MKWKCNLIQTYDSYHKSILNQIVKFCFDPHSFSQNHAISVI